MIISKIKEHFLQKDILETSNSNKRVVAVNKIKSIGILTSKELNDAYDFESKVKRVFPKYRSVNCYCYRDFNKKDEKSFDYFSQNDFDWKGKIKDDSLHSFVNEPFDVLLCYFNTNNIFLENLTKQSQASFKIGFSNVNEILFDLEISENIENVDNFNLELKKYLQILGSVEV
jgi:hypothetical protein